MPGVKDTLLGKDSDYETLGSLVRTVAMRNIFSGRRLEDKTFYSFLEPQEIGVIIANSVKGEEQFNPEKYSEGMYEHQMGFRLRDKVFSVLIEIEEKGVQREINKQIKELRKALDHGFIGQSSLSLSYMIYRKISQESLIINVNSQNQLNPQAKAFFSDLYHIPANDIPQEQDFKRSSDPIGTEYDLFYKKLQKRVVLK